MLRTIDHLIRKIYAPFLLGMPLFFITISPYSNQDANDKKKEKKSFKQITMDSQQMVQNALEGDMLMPESEDPEVSLYNLYLAKAAVPSPFVENGSRGDFMPMTTDIRPTASQEVSYQDLLDAYLQKVEYMIDVEKDYFNALMELDKVMMIAPQNKKAQYLRIKLKQKLKQELEDVKKKRGNKAEIRSSQEIDVKEKALLEAEKQLLTEALKTKPYRAKVAAEQSVTSSQKKSVSDDMKQKTVSDASDGHTDGITQVQKNEKTTPQKSTPRVHRDVVIIKNEDLIRIKAKEKAGPNEDEARVGTLDVPKATVTPAKPSVVQPVEVLELSGGAGAVLTAQEAERVSERSIEKPPARTKTQDRMTVREDRAKKYLMRGKQYYRDGNLALALISLSKAHQFDIQQQYSVEIEQLINMTRTRLETAVSEG